MWRAERAAAFQARETARRHPIDHPCLPGRDRPRVYTLDLAFALPLPTVGAIRLLRGDPRGPGTALAFLVYSVLMGLEVLAIFLFEVQAGGAVDASITLVFAAVVVIGASLGILGLAPRRRRILVAPVSP